MEKIRLVQNKINPLVLPVIFADKLGYFEKFNVPVDLTIAETFQFAKKSSFVAGDVDAMMGDLTFYFDYREQGKDAVVTTDLTRTIQLLAKKDAPKNGMRVGVARKGLFPFFMAYDLKNILTTPEIVWVDNTYERIKMLAAGEIDALVAIEPFITDILTSQTDTEILWHSKNSDKNMVMWCFDRKFYQQNPETVVNFHRALEAAAQDFNALSGDEKVAQAINVAQYTKEAAENIRHFTFEKQHNYSAQDFNLLADFLWQSGKISEKYQAANCLKAVF